MFKHRNELFLNYSWEIQIEGGDIKFSIESMDEDGHKTEIVASKRISTTFVNEIGFFECAAPGTCTYPTLQNMKKKKLTYP